MEANPVQQAAFHRWIEAQFATLSEWTNVVDFEGEFGLGLSSKDVAFVDVGGGLGQQCQGRQK